MYTFDVYSNELRDLPVDKFINELRLAIEHKSIRYIRFKDDSFLLRNRKWIEAFSKEYKNHIGLPFIIKVTPQTIDRVKLMTLKDAGLVIVILNIISGSERVCAEVLQRRLSHSYLILSSQILVESKVFPIYEIVSDSPFETEEDKVETISVMASLKRPFLIHTVPFHLIPKPQIIEMSPLEKTTEKNAFKSPYFNKLLFITPHAPRLIIRYLNKPRRSRNLTHSLLLNILYLTAKFPIKPISIILIIARLLHLNPLRALMTFILILRLGKILKPL